VLVYHSKTKLSSDM